MNARSSWLLPTGQTREDTRVTQVGALTPTSPLRTRSGILPGSSGGQVRISGFTATGASAMAATVSPGRALVQGADSQGAYPVALTDPATLVFADGDAQFPRVDLVVVRVYDDPYDGSGLTQATVEIVPGTPAATPAPPAVPNLALPLYEVTVPAGASAGNGGIPWSTALADRRTPTVAAGGILPVVSDTTPGAYPGQYRDVNGILQRWDGAAWQQYPAVPAWQSWTPTWTTSSGLATPSYGNATVNCRYLHTGPAVHLNFEIVFGSTTNFGTGGTGDNWRFGLPVPAASLIMCIGFMELSPPAATPRCLARMRCTGTTFFELEIDTGRTDATAVSPSGIADSATPWAWASGYCLRGAATYEAAA